MENTTNTITAAATIDRSPTRTARLAHIAADPVVIAAKALLAAVAEEVTPKPGESQCFSYHDFPEYRQAVAVFSSACNRAGARWDREFFANK